MRADESLMIGDWILDGHVYAQVTSITCDGIIETTHNEFSNIELVEPIPLTPEILEKNGFKRDPLWHHCDKDLDNYSISVQLGYANRIEYIKITEKGKDNVIPSERTKLYLTHIKFVHQLQHALRLCGIEKEIVL